MGEGSDGHELLLPVYGAVGGHDPGARTVVSGIPTPGEDGPNQRTSASVRHADGDRVIEVTSHSDDGTPIDELRHRALIQGRALGDRARRTRSREAGPQATGPPGNAVGAWQPGVISVDQAPTDFAVARVDDGWVAVGAGPLSIITIAAHKVPVGEISLERLPDLRHLPRAHRPVRSPRRRQFPPEALTAARDALGPANVDLTYAEDRLVGTYQGLDIDLELHVPHSRSRTSGLFAGSDMAATWQLGHNFSEHPEVRSSLHGRFGDQTVYPPGGTGP